MSLEKPSFPQAVDGVIDVKRLNGDYIRARVKRWFNAGNGDKVEVHFANRASPYVVSPNDHAFMEVSCDPRLIPDGEYDVYYVATNLAQNQRLSETEHIRVINSQLSEFPKPRFPEATYDPDYHLDTLFYKPIVAEKGTQIVAAYSSMKRGDTVVFHLRGQKMSGDSVSIEPEPTPPLTDEDVAKGYVSALIPSTKLLSLGNGGMIFGLYEVVGLMTQSPEASARISWRDIDKLSLNITQFAPGMTNEIRNAYSAVTVFGPPGQQVFVSVSDPALIYTPSGTGEDTVSGPLDENGIARYKVYQPSLAAGAGISTLVAAQPGPGDTSNVAPADGQATFLDYQTGPGDIIGYAHTTGAAADGVAPCSVYIKADPSTSATSVRVTLTGNAVIKGHPHLPADIPLSPDTKFCSFDVTDMHAEPVTVTIELAGSAALPLPLRFVVFPAS